jgi:hypothetical protein
LSNKSYFGLLAEAFFVDPFVGNTTKRKYLLKRVIDAAYVLLEPFVGRIANDVAVCISREVRRSAEKIACLNGPDDVELSVRR